MNPLIAPFMAIFLCITLESRMVINQWLELQLGDCWSICRKLYQLIEVIEVLEHFKILRVFWRIPTTGANAFSLGTSLITRFVLIIFSFFGRSL